MKALAAEARRWSVIARVRELRVRRRQIALAEARRVADAARAEREACEARHAHHAAQRADLLARCTHGLADSGLWRIALVQHRLQDVQLLAAVGVAQSALAHALVECGRTRTLLQRETLARDDAKKRVRELAARLREQR